MNYITDTCHCEPIAASPKRNYNILRFKDRSRKKSNREEIWTASLFFLERGSEPKGRKKLNTCHV